MQSADADVIARMIKELAAFHDDVSTVGAADVLTYGLGVGRLATVWLALSGHDPAGFAVAYDWMNFVRGSPVRHIDLLFVDDRFRRRGIGSALIRRIVRDAKVSNCDRVSVGAADDNPTANAFYVKLGFEPRDDSARQYRVAGASLDRMALEAGASDS